MALRHLVRVSVLVLLAWASMGALGMESRDGPIASMTGAPAIGGAPEEYNCTLCHLGLDWENFNTPGGGAEILDVPDAWETGQSYPLTVRLFSDSTAAYPERAWGFQITAIRMSDGEGCGTWELPDPDTLQVLPGDGPFASRSYVTHTRIGSRGGLGGEVRWTFSWRAPDEPEGTVLFQIAAVAANGNDELIGDFVYTASDTSADATTPVVPVSWGGLKSRYRR